MRFHFVLPAVLFASVMPDAVLAIPPRPEIVSVTGVDKKLVMGELGRETELEIEILDLKTRQGTLFKKSELKTIRKEINEREAIDRFGLPVYMAWRIKKVLPVDSASGKVAQLDGDMVYVSIGKNAGLEPGQELVVYRGSNEIKDPDTGEVIGKQRRKIARLGAVSVEEKLTKAKLLGDLELKLEVGDVVEPAVVASSIAILPMVNSNGDETDGTRRIAEQLTSGLVNLGVSVVERRLLDKVLGELGLQQGASFESSEAQKVGHQLGAYAIVIGSVAPKGKLGEAQLRLVRVETGEILLAASQVISGLGEVASTIDKTNTKSTKVKSKPNKMTQLSMKTEEDLAKLWKLPSNPNDWQIENGGVKLPGRVQKLESVFQLQGDCEIWITCGTSGWKGPAVRLFGETIAFPPPEGGWPISYQVRIIRTGSTVDTKIALSQPGIKRNLERTVSVAIKKANLNTPTPLVFVWADDTPGLTLNAIAVSKQGFLEKAD